MSWRLLRLKAYDAYMNMAIDEAILSARIAELVPNTLRFYRWRPSAVSIGKFQKAENEVNFTNCMKNNITIVRRITGGGSVYHDAHDEVTYSVVVNKRELGTSEITEIYSKIYRGISDALRLLGIAADFNEGNTKACPNLTVQGKKISGSAQTHKKGTVLQHGTLLLNVDLERMFTFLRVPWARSCIEVVNIARNRITSLSSQTGNKVSLIEVSEALAEGFQEAFGTEFKEGRLTPYELDLASTLRKDKYATDEWNLHGKSKMSTAVGSAS